MIKNPPKRPYNGLTIILSNPSRFDTAKDEKGYVKLISSSAGYFFETKCLAPLSIDRYACDIRVKEDTSELLPNTKAILLLGEEAMWHCCTSTKDNTLGELRGSPLAYKGVVAIASFLPQDCVDVSNWEKKLNPLLSGDNDDSENTDENSSLGEKRRHGKTNRKNYSFWLKKDCAKIGILLDNNGVIPSEPQPYYHIYPAAEEIVQLLTTTKNETLYFDCETDSNLNFTCFSFSFGLSHVYVVPIVRHDYSHAYSRLAQIFRALSISIRDNTLVAHNGSSFDFFVLAFKYHISIGKSVYDTMIAQHRCFPEVEKSLGHCTSLWTWQPFHKDEGNFSYGTREQAESLWKYCGKDTYTMILIKEAIDKYEKTIPGLSESIRQAMESIRPYLITSLLGINYDRNILLSIIAENDRLMQQYIRMAELLIGKEFIRKIKGNSKKPMLNSNTQCVKYFHDLLGYPVVAVSKKTGKPSLAKKNLFKLKLKNNNPIIDIAIAYRETQKETGALNFTPWKV